MLCLYHSDWQISVDWSERACFTLGSIMFENQIYNLIMAGCLFPFISTDWTYPVIQEDQFLSVLNGLIFRQHINTVKLYNRSFSATSEHFLGRSPANFWQEYLPCGKLNSILLLLKVQYVYSHMIHLLMKVLLLWEIMVKLLETKQSTFIQYVYSEAVVVLSNVLKVFRLIGGVGWQ